MKVQVEVPDSKLPDVAKKEISALRRQVTKLAAENLRLKNQLASNKVDVEKAQQLIEKFFQLATSEFEDRLRDYYSDGV